MTDKRPTFELHIDTRVLSELLENTPVGETCTYAVMSKELGRPVSGADSYVQSAVRRVQNQNGKVFGNIRGEGYRCLSDSEIVKSAEQDARFIRRKAKRAAVRLTKVQDFGALTKDEQIMHNAKLSLFGAITSISAQKGVKQLEKAVSQAGSELPIGRTLEVFKS